MAHFAKLDNNNVVLNVEVVADKDCQDSNGNESDAIGQAFLQNVHGVTNTYKRTSYNTRGGKHYIDRQTLSDTQEKAFRKNYATIGGTYDPIRDAFIDPKNYESWTLNETTCLWDPPVAIPSNKKYTNSEGVEFNYELDWDEDNLRWLGYEREEPYTVHIWNPDNSQWVST
tara:strand:- start:4333 stop:4845 length:513 start_codon:yes stop_codon:yes gene_type:complete